MYQMNDNCKNYIISYVISKYFTEFIEYLLFNLRLTRHSKHNIVSVEKYEKRQ